MTDPARQRGRYPEPLTIALFSDSALPVMNGVSISVDLLMRELRNRGHDVHLFAPLFWRHRDTDPNIHRFLSLQAQWTEDYPIALPPYSLWLPRFHQIQADIVHTHTPFASGLIGQQWARLTNLPIISTYHTHYDRYAHYVPMLPLAFKRRLVWQHTESYYNKMDCVVTPSAASKQWLRRHNVATPIEVVPTGVQDYKVSDRESVRKQFQLPDDRLVALYVGRLAMEKNLDLLFQSIAKSMHRRPNLEFWLVGDGPHRHACEELAKELGIASRVTFHGQRDRAEVEQYYVAADIFVFASTTETQGLVVQEAMNNGLPCVVARGGGASMALVEGETGLIASPTIESLHEGIEKLLSDPGLRDQIGAAARAASRKFGVAGMVDRMEGIYRSVIQERLVADA